MKYTSEDVRREADEYRKWARQRDREQFTAYMTWVRNNHQRIKKEEGLYESQCRVVDSRP